MDADEMLREDRAEWDALVTLLEAHPDEALHDPSSPPWTSRDVFAHLARWIDWSMDLFEACSAGERLPPIKGTDDEINARWQQEDNGLSLQEAREKAQRAFERRRRLVESVPASGWNDELEANARADGVQHFRDHRGYIVVT